MELDFEWGDQSLLYESAVEEIALEGLDGITLQALFERLADRETAPISKNEAEAVHRSIWNSLKRDIRLQFYLLPIGRPLLRIWDRNGHHDERGVLLEPPEAPSEIYTFKSVEVKHGGGSKIGHYNVGGNTRLTAAQLDRSSLSKKETYANNRGEMLLGGIRFSRNPVPQETPVPVSPSRKSRRIGKKNKEKGNSGSADAMATNPEVPTTSTQEGVVTVRGSCADFESRMDISKAIRRLNMSYTQAVVTLGHRLVIVANQLMRDLLLFRSSNQYEVNGIQYCMVERIGRSRSHGEQARGKISLAVTGIDPKSLFYLRTALLSEGIISKQPLIMRFDNGKTGTLISIFHLPHFFRREETAEAIKIRKIVAYISNSPKNQVDFFKLQHSFGKYLMRSLAEDYKDFVKIEEVPYEEMYPEEVANERKQARKESLLKRKVRVIGFRNPELTLRDVIQKQLCSSSRDEGEDSESSSNFQENDGDGTFDWEYCYVPDKELAHESEMCQILRLLILKGQEGVLQQEVSEERALTSLDARAGLRYFSKWKVVRSCLEERGKTKVTRYVYFKCPNPTPKTEPKLKRTLESDSAMDPLLIVPFDIATASMESLEASEESPKKSAVWKSRRKLAAPVPENATSEETTAGTKRKRGTDKSQTSKELLPLGAPPPRKRSKIRAWTTKGTKKRTSKKDYGRIDYEESDLPLTHQPFVSSTPLKRRRIKSRLVDSIDREAANKKARQRLDWTAQEDRLLLYLYISSVLFVPRYNLDRVIIYNALQLRDILHNRLPEARTKTSGIVRRRVHTMFKTRTLFSRYRELLDVALRDEELYAKYIEPHLPPPSTQVVHKISTEALTAVLNYVTKKFDLFNALENRLNNNPVAMKMDLETLLNARELRRMETAWLDIWSKVFHTFYRRKKKLTSIVPILPTAVVELNKEGLVVEEQGPSWLLPYTTTEETKHSEEEGEEITSAYADDQLELTYNISSSLIASANRILIEEPPSSSSSSGEDEDNDVEILAMNEETQTKKTALIRRKLKGRGSDVVDLCTANRNTNSSSEIFRWLCRTIFMSILVGGGSTPSLIRPFLSVIPDSILDNLVNGLRLLNVFKEERPYRKLVLTNVMKRKLTNQIHPTSFQHAHVLLDAITEHPLKNTTWLKWDRIGSAYLLAELGTMININYEIPSSIITVRDEWSYDYESILASQVCENGREEETAFRLLRLRINADTQKEKLVEKDFFEVNLPHLDVSPKEAGSRQWQDLVYGDMATEKTNLENRLLQTVTIDEDDGAAKTFSTETCSELYTVIDITEDLGLSMEFLMKYWDPIKLTTSLTELIRNHWVYMVGVRHPKYVSRRHMKKWTMFFPDDGSGLTGKRVVARTWVDASGNVNWRFIDRVMVALLSLLQKSCHIHVHKLAQSLSPILSQVEILVLLSALVDLKVITLFKFRVKRKPNGFHTSFADFIDDTNTNDDIEAPFKVYSIDTLLDLNEAWVELLPFHVTKYCRLQNLIAPISISTGLDDEELNVYSQFEPEDVELMLSSSIAPESGIYAEEEEDEDSD